MIFYRRALEGFYSFLILRILCPWLGTTGCFFFFFHDVLKQLSRTIEKLLKLAVFKLFTSLTF